MYSGDPAPHPRPRTSSNNATRTSSGNTTRIASERDYNYNDYSQATANPYSSSSNYDGYYRPAASIPPRKQDTQDLGGRQYMDVYRRPLNDGIGSDLDSDITSARPHSMSSASRDGDLESVASGHSRSSVVSSSDVSMFDVNRYRGEQYRPVAAPRKVNSQVKTLFGEIHPRLLKPEELPSFGSSADEAETSSLGSYTPRAWPRDSMRSNKHTAVKFLEDEAIRLENASLRSILIWDVTAERKPKRIVRFEHVDKRPLGTKKDFVDYSDIDSGESKVSHDIWKNMTPMSSGRQSKSNRRQSDSTGSTSRSRSPGRRRTASMTSNSSQGSSRRSHHSQSGKHAAQRQPARNSHKQSASYKVSNGQVETGNSMVAELRAERCWQDKQKVCKWSLIIGIPVVLIITAAAVLAGIFSNSGG